MRTFIISFVVVLLTFTAQAQDATKKASKINWLSFEEAVEKNKKDPKPILIDIYTDWCHWCKVMDDSTYQNSVIVAMVNKYYYPVKLNGEEKKDITYKGRTYTFKKQGRRGYHELAAAIMNGQMSYPSTAFLNKDEQLLQNVPGYVKEKRFEIILAYFSKENYKNTSWKDFEKNFKSSI
jgi:uncharacterized protein YyaL (SSP411 family)